MLERECLKETIKAYRNGDLAPDKTDSDEKIRDLWWDWFCKDSSLVNKGRILLRRLNQIADSKKIDQDKTYVWFKNHCPGSGCLYDSISINEIGTRRSIYNIIPKSGHECDDGKALLYGPENNFEEPLVEGTWKDIKAWFNN